MQNLDYDIYRSYSQLGEDRILRTHFFDELKVTRAYYVDVGAFHPVHHSNTFLFYQLGWRGITVEPNPDVRDLFLKTRPGDVHVQGGIAKLAGRERFVRFTNPLHSTFDLAAAESVLSSAQRSSRVRDVLDVDVVPLAAILGRMDTRNLPFGILSVDVEGKDLEVLESNDWKKYRPLTIVAEDHDFHVSDPNASAICKFLTDQGYVLTSKAYFSLIFHREDVAPSSV